MGRQVITGILALLLAGCVPTAPRAVSRTITYRVTGTAVQADISYANETNGMDHVKGHPNPNGQVAWQKDVTLASGSFAYVTAQSDTSGNTMIVAEISYGGQIVQHSESNGEYCVATASVRID
jgi:hypothetical protein